MAFSEEYESLRKGLPRVEELSTFMPDYFTPRCRKVFIALEKLGTLIKRHNCPIFLSFRVIPARRRPWPRPRRR